MRKFLATVVALATLPVIALLMPDTGVRAGTFPGNNGRIALRAETATANQGSQFDIATVKPDGTGFANLTPSDALAGESPDWSADNTKIAFIGSTDADPNGAVYTMNADGSSLEKHTSGDTFDRPANPSWSPDGSKIVFTAPAAGGGFGLWILTLADDSTVALTNNAGNLLDKAAAWSPDGDRIAYTFVNGNDGTGNGIYTVDADGTNETMVTDSSSSDSTVSWSPDGTHLVFDTSGGELSTVAADGTDEEVIPNTTFGIQPAWSPDGLKIAYADTTQSPVSIAAINLDGTGKTEVFQANDELESFDPAWGGFEATPTATSTTSTSTTTTSTSTTTTSSTTSTSTTTSTTSTSTSTIPPPTTTSSSAPPTTAGLSTSTTRPVAALPRTGGGAAAWLWVASALALTGAAVIASSGALRRRVGAHFTAK